MAIKYSNSLKNFYFYAIIGTSKFSKRSFSVLSCVKYYTSLIVLAVPVVEL